MIPQHIGIDIHKEMAVIAAVDDHQNTIWSPLKVAITDLPHWAAQTLTAQDRVVIEVTSNAWHSYDILSAHAGEVLVANPYKTKLIAEAHIKSDKVDALALARLLAARFICTVWVPPIPVRQQRALAAHRAALAEGLARTQNRIHALLHRHDWSCPEARLWGRAGRAWLDSLSLPLGEALELDHLLGQWDFLHTELDEAKTLIARSAAHDPRIPKLLQIAGIGCYTAFALLAAIGPIQRFASPDKLSAYAGLAPSLHQSAQRTYRGSITKAGNPLLRWLMVEAAHTAVRWDPHWRRVYEQLRCRRGDSIAIVAVARKLLVVVWHLLSRPTVYYYLQPQTFITKLQTWVWHIGHTHLPAPSSADFIRDQLVLVGLQALIPRLHSDKKGKLRVRAA